MTDPTSSTDSGSGGGDDVKRRFREALQRKQAKAKAGEAHIEGDAKLAQPHGPASHKRDFRRKSG